jgi:hypothetical protein
MKPKKTAKPGRPGQGQPGGPPNPAKVKVSPGLTVLGGFVGGTLKGNRAPLSNATIKELKAIIAKNQAAEAAAAKNSKQDAKIIKQQNKKPIKPNSAKATAVGLVSKKPVVKVAPPRGGGLRGGMGFGGGSGLRGNVNK